MTFHHRLLHVGLDEGFNFFAGVWKSIFVVWDSFHDQVHVDLQTLKLGSIIDISIFGENLGDLSETSRKKCSTLVSLGEGLELRRV